jgi:hypothetical protein
MRDLRFSFGATIAIVLLGIYAYAVIEAIRVALSDTPGNLGIGFSYTLEIVGGLVSALVVVELAITKPGDAIGVRSAAAATNEVATVEENRAAAIIGTVYVLVWILVGLAAYVVGAMLYPDKVKALTDFGQTWLGLAVAAGYAYFGIGPRS